MLRKAGCGVFLCLVLILLAAAVFVAGCEEDNGPDVPLPPAANMTPKFVAGDIIGKPTSASATSQYLILGYDQGRDQYERAWIRKNDNGTWGYRTDASTDKASRALVEKVYTEKIAHVNPASVPVLSAVTSESEVAVPETTLTGDSPVIYSISPTSGSKDSTMTIMITGKNFLEGATAQLILPGYTPVTGTILSVTSSRITGTFTLNGIGTGHMSVTVINPDGKSITLPDAFTAGAVAPSISSVEPDSAYLNTTSLPITVNGQNFKETLTVTFVKGKVEIPCSSPVWKSSEEVTCNLDLTPVFNASAGTWSVVVKNVEDGQSGSWLKPFTVRNDTP